MSVLKNMWVLLTSSREEIEGKARQEYLTRVVFVLVSVALILMTIIVIVLSYGLGEPEHEPPIIILCMDVLILGGWLMIYKHHWRVSRYLLLAMFLAYSGYMVITVGMYTSAVLQLAITILLTGMLFGNRASWFMWVICLVVYLGGGWIGGERDAGDFLIGGAIVGVSLGWIALLQLFFSNLLNSSLRAAYESEAEVRSIFRAAPIGIGTVINRVIQEANDTLCHMTGYTREELVGKSARMLYPSQEEYEYVGTEKYRQIHEKDVGTVETRWRLKNGEVRDILLSSAPLEPGDLLQGVTFSALDITERKQAEAKQAALLKEKEILLAEVHHRVKNNMQVITSLLSLQAEEVTDDCTHRLLNESRNRIQSMALVHEQLYRSGEYASIDLTGYINQLASTLFSMYQVNSDHVHFRVEAENVKLDLVRAIPCGLLLNEMITNSLKYAFPQGRKGEMWVKLQTGKEKVILEVGDDGIGLPERFDFQTARTLGLQLINLLVTHDLQGSISYESNQGTQFHIEFPSYTQTLCR